MAITHPTDIPNCVLCLLSENITGVADGGRLASWPDASGLTHDATQATANLKPIYVASDPDFGWPAVRTGTNITGTDHGWMNLPDIFNGATGANGVEAIAVLRADAASGADNTVGLWDFEAAAGAECWYRHSNGNIYMRFANSAQLVNNPVAAVNVVHRLDAWSKTNDMGWNYNGVTKNSTAANTISLTTTPKFGCNANFSTYRWNGRWFALIAYSRKLTTTERGDLDTWLQRYQAALPVAPSVPGAFTSPAAGDRVSGATVAVNWGDSTGSPTSYTLEKSSDGGATWSAVASGLATSDYTWNVTALAAGYYQLRAKGVNGVGSGPWVTSGIFGVNMSTLETGGEIWTLINSYGPEVLWKFKDIDGTVAADASANARPGTYQGTTLPTLRRTSIIPNVPGDTAVLFTAAQKQMAKRAHEAWMNGDTFTMGFWYKPATVAAYDLFGKQERVQAWLEASGALSFYEFDSDWRVTSSAAAVIAAATAYMIVIKNDIAGSVRNIYVNGVAVATSSAVDPQNTVAPYSLEVGHSSADDTNTRFSDGTAQGFFWIPSALTTAQVLAMYNQSQVSPVPPPTPGAFTEPTLGEVIHGIVNINFPDSATAVSYDIDYSQDSGATWHSIVAAHGTSDYAWDTTAIPAGATLVRARANNTYGSSAYRISDSFTIAHYAPGINFVAHGIIDDIVHDAPTLPPYDSGETALGAWMTDLVPDAAKWTPIGPRTTRWREGYGYYLPLGGGRAMSLRQSVPRLWAYGGPLYDESGTLIEGDVVPAIGDNNPMILKHAHIGVSTAGLFTSKIAEVCLWRDPVTGSALIYRVGYPASLRFYDGTSHSMSGDIAGTTHFTDGSTAAVHQPLLGSFGGGYDDDLVAVGFSVVAGIVTLYFDVDLTKSSIVQPLYWTVDLSAYIGVNGGVAYARTIGSELGEWRTLRLSTADYIEITGLQPGWIVRAERRIYENWIAYDTSVPYDHSGEPPTRSAEAVRYVTIEVVADGAGTARLHSNQGMTQRRVHDRMPEWDGTGIDYTITSPDQWTFDSLAVLIDSESEVDRYTDLKNVRMGDTFAWGHMDLPAYRPVAFISPNADQIVGAVLPQAVTITAHVPAHPEAETVKYQWEYSANGVDWVLAQDWQAAVTFNWNHGALPFTRNAQFRVRARGDVSLVPSGWLYSGVFILYHSAGALTVDGTSPLEVVGNVTQFSVFAQPVESPDGHKGTRWKIWSRETDSVVIDEILYGDKRSGGWLTGLEEATTYDIQYALIDYLDVQGAFSAKHDFVTLNMAAHSPHVAADPAGNAEGSYRNVNAPAIDGVTGGVPELLGGGGVRLNEYGIDYAQTPAGFPNKSHHMVRMLADTGPGYRGAVWPGEVGGHREGFTALLVLTPYDLSEAREIMGKGQSLFVWHDATGGLHATIVGAIRQEFHIIAYGDGEEEYMSANSDFNIGQRLEKDVMQALFFGGQGAWYGTELALLEPSGTPIEIRVPEAPETVVQSMEMYASIDGTWKPTHVVSLFNGGVPVSDRFHLEPSRIDQWDIGHGSVNADAADDVEASGRFARMLAHRFVFWRSLLDVAAVRTLHSFVAEGDLVALDRYLDDMDPQPYSRPPFGEYPRPHKPTVSA